MNYEVEVISKILNEDLMDDALELNVEAELFHEYKKEWEFVKGIYLEHSGLPSSDYLEQKFPTFDTVITKEPLTLLVDELKKRHVHSLVLESMRIQAEALKAKDPYEALSEMRKTIAYSEEKMRTSRDVNVAADPESRLEDYRAIVDLEGMTGLPSPWDVLDRETQGIQSEDFVMVAARGGVGKCIDKESLLQDPITGVLRTIEEVVSGDQLGVLTWDKSEGVRHELITDKVDTGFKQCKEFLLQSGRSIIVTPEHPFLTPGGWVPADKIELEGYVAIPSRVPFPLKVRDLHQSEIEMMAILLSEGTYSGNHVGFDNQDPKFIQVARNAAKGFNVDVRYRGTTSYDFCVKGVSAGRHTPNPVRSWLKTYGMDRKKAVDKTIPDVVFGFGFEGLSYFIALFWMADGYVDKRGTPGITLGSKKMVYQIQHLLLRFGIQSSVRYKPVKGGYHSWRLRVYSGEVLKFNASIAPHMWGDKLGRIRARVSDVEKVFNPNIGGPRCRNPLPDHRDLIWVRVEGILDAGKRKIYDLTVEPTSCFIANDILVHNTWCEVVWAEFLRRKGHPGVLFSKEMSVKQILRRFDAVAASVPFNRLKSGSLTTAQFEQYKKTLIEMKGTTPLHISGDIDAKMGVSNVAAKIDMYAPKIVFIDGVYMMRDERNAKASWEKFTNICEDLKELTKKKRTPIVVTHQFNLSGKDGNGNEDTLKYGDVQMWFDLMLGMYQSDDLRASKEMLFKLNKIREGSKIDWVTAWDLDGMDFDTKVSGIDDVGEYKGPRDKDGDSDGFDDVVPF